MLVVSFAGCEATLAKTLLVTIVQKFLPDQCTGGESTMVPGNTCVCMSHGRTARHFLPLSVVFDLLRAQRAAAVRKTRALADDTPFRGFEIGRPTRELTCTIRGRRQSKREEREVRQPYGA